MRDVGRHGDGSIVRRKDGRLQVSITLTTGRRIYRTVPRLSDSTRQRELAERMRRELVAMREAEIDPGGQTLAVWLRSWLDSMASARHARLRPNTLAGYSIIAEKHLIPALGSVRLEALRVRHVQAWLDGLDLSPQYVANCRAFLRRVLNVAVRQRMIRDNPAIPVELPTVETYRAKPLTADEAKRLLAAASEDRHLSLWRLAIVTGFRVGELLALGWDDVDTKAGLVTVRARLARRNRAWVRVPTKAARRIETVAIDRVTADILIEHRRVQATERRPDWPYWGHVFLTPNGYPLERHGVMEAFRAACDRAGIDRRRIHDLRGSSATLLADLGVPEDVRMARLGHATKAMSRHYAAASAAQDRAAVERLAEAIGG